MLSYVAKQYVTLADVIKVKGLKNGEVILEYVGDPNIIMWVLESGKVRQKSGSESCNGKEREILNLRETCLIVAGFGDEAKGSWAKKQGGL